MNILLLSTYELGHQPLGLARPAAHLAAAGHAVRCQDLAIERLDASLVRDAQLVGVSIPMHTATRLGIRVAQQVRAINPVAHLCFYGLYASLHADVLLGELADSVIGGELEGPLVELAERLDMDASPWTVDCGPRSANGDSRSTAHDPRTISGVISREADGGTFLGRQSFGLPRRDLLPGLDHYARVDTGTGEKLVGYVEASRGCAHRCLHCPITPVYGGRLRIVSEQVVLDDIRQLVAMGAEHITFGDPDFFNGIRHSLRLVEAMHAEFPQLTYDATIKVEHLLEHRQHLAKLNETGCLFIVSAVEAVQDHVLEHLQKGHTAADVEQALALTASAGLTLRPTFVAFTPWTSIDDYLGLLDFVARHRLVRHVDAVQYAIRLLIPKGSSLIGTPAMKPFLGPFDEASFSYVWRHPDPRVDRLQQKVGAMVEQAARDGEGAGLTFSRIYELAQTSAGQSHRTLNTSDLAALPAVPRLTEPWFC